MKSKNVFNNWIIKTVLQSFLVFVVAQLISIFTTYLWLTFDKTEYGFGGGLIMILVYLACSIVISIIGSIIIILTLKEDKRKIIALVLLVQSWLHSSLIPSFYFLMSFYLLMK